MSEFWPSTNRSIVKINIIEWNTRATISTEKKHIHSDRNEGEKAWNKVTHSRKSPQTRQIQTNPDPCQAANANRNRFWVLFSSSSVRWIQSANRFVPPWPSPTSEMWPAQRLAASRGSCSSGRGRSTSSSTGSWPSSRRPTSSSRSSTGSSSPLTKGCEWLGARFFGVKAKAKGALVGSLNLFENLGTQTTWSRMQK